LPKLTRFYLKSSFVWLLLALTLAILQVWPQVQRAALVRAATPLKFHFLMLGWVLQLIFGVIYWMFPKASQERPRGHEGRNWLAFILINMGLLLRSITEPFNTIYPSPTLGFFLAASGLAQWLGVSMFVLEAWPRVKLR
jgi:heme/copper-type cytochrome/quinol oxidase subunit 1